MGRSRQRIMYGSGMTFYAGPPMQGYGLGNVLARLARTIIPIFQRPVVKAGLKRIGKSAAVAGLDAIQKSLSSHQDEPITFSQALKQSATKQAKQLTAEAKRQLLYQPSRNAIKRTAVKRKLSVPISTIRRQGNKDIFG